MLAEARCVASLAKIKTDVEARPVSLGIDPKFEVGSGISYDLRVPFLIGVTPQFHLPQKTNFFLKLCQGF